MTAATVNGDRPLDRLATELRTVVTPVLGYLELLAEVKNRGPLSEEHLCWVETVEARLGSLQPLTDELLAACARLRELSATEAAT